MFCPSRRDGSLGRISNDTTIQRAVQEQSLEKQWLSARNKRCLPNVFSIDMNVLTDKTLILFAR
jgi:hypothetical protein